MLGRIALRTVLFTYLLSASVTSLTPSTNSTIAAGYHVIYSWSGTPIPAELTQLATQGVVGGLIIFGDNVDNSLPGDIASLQSAYAASPAYAGAPLLILTDQEGGEVARLPGGPSASEKEIGLSASPSAAASAAGTTMASALKAYNHNGNLAPVGGVFRSPGDFLDQYQRSYSNNSAIAAECMSANIPAQQGAGIIATAKHFPGLGGAAANQDTDAEPVTINFSLNTLRTIDEAPFKAAIQAGVKMVMASWALYPALDDVYPSGLSTKWIQNELRSRLGFTGVTITDAIEAGALQSFGSNYGYRAILASNAGMDIILASNGEPSEGQLIVSALSEAVENGTISSSAFKAASQRILDLRSGIPS